MHLWVCTLNGLLLRSFTVQLKDGRSCDSVLLEDTVQELSPSLLACNLLLTLRSQTLQAKLDVPRRTVQVSKESRE
jgi:hypothetical protein